jgi:putative membrane protein
MKKKIFLYLAMPLSLLACNGGTNKDSVDKADSSNEVKSDSTSTSNTMDTTTKSNGVLAVDESTAKFLVNVADVSMTEVQLGQIAAEKASNQRVKDFGSMMVKDHSAANDELKTLAANKNVTLPGSISEEHQKKIDDLNKKTGKDFDKAYMDMMEDGHESTVKDFEKNNDNKDADVKAFVNKMLPTLKMHLDSAKAIKKALK